MAPGWVGVFLLAGVCGALEELQTHNVSQKCMKDINTFLWEINQDKPKEYAVLMYDAFGKMGSGVEGGNVNQPGLLQQCRSTAGPGFCGQYCQVFLKQGAVHYFVGVCVPDSCGEEDVKKLLLDGQLQLNLMSLVPPLPSILSNRSAQEMIMTHCLSNAPEPDASGVALLLFQLSLTDHSLSVDRSSSVQWCTSRRCVYGCLQAFSLQTTCRSVFSFSSSVTCGSYSSLNGIRVLSLLWIICGHSTQFPVINNLDNYKTWRKRVESSPIYIFTISGPVFLAVDTFLLLGGLLSARSLLKSIDKMIFPLLSFCPRIQPLHLFIMCLTISLISLVHWGPYWFPFMDTMMDCKTYWWANLLLISNLLPVHEICIPWTWYLSLDFQCYATTPLLVYFYRLKKSVFAVVVGGLLLMSTVASAVTTAHLHLPVFQPSTMTSENYVLYYYVKPYTRYGPFLLGILMGIDYPVYLLDQWQAALGWFCCLSLMASLVGFAYFLKETPAHPSLPHAVYQGLHRPVWALTVSWIILACEEGYGGFIKELLSFSFWVPVSNISFACYLIHPVFIILYNGLQETPIHYSDINFMYLFLGHLVLTLVVSCALTVLVENSSQDPLTWCLMWGPDLSFRCH
uniref:O-acyltransferase like n=1 Tax=Kryptolebias marmoratus TaxID=37003 RepID=A0A3Q3AQK9_KRYMA